MSRTAVLFGAALTVVLLSGLAHGVWTQRWRTSPERESAATRLESVPLLLGAWEGERLEMEPGEVRAAGIDGYLMRRYRKRGTGDSLSVLVVCGRPGLIAAHTPEVCYGSSGHELVGQPTTCTIASVPFWTARFRKDDPAGPAYLRLFWAFNATGAWAASDDPRVEFARYPALYKLYLVREMSGADESLAADPCLDFIGKLLPELHQALFP